MPATGGRKKAKETANNSCRNVDEGVRIVMNQKKYIELPRLGMGVYASKEWEPVLVGTHVETMRASMKSPEYDDFAEKYDVIFLFEDDDTKPAFYVVPMLSVFARDSVGGFFAENNRESLGEPSQIVYISKELRCYLLAENMENFVENPIACMECKKETDEIRVFRDKAEACEIYEIIALEDLLEDAGDKSSEWI